MYSTRVSRLIAAPRSEVFAALTDGAAVARWRIPDGMTARVHEFDARPGGRLRVSLVYDEDRPGKSGSRTDTYSGHFAELVADEQVSEVIEFETGDAALLGPMTMTTSLADADGGTEVVIVHEGIPDAVPRGDNEAGTRSALDRLARLVEAGRS